MIIHGHSWTFVLNKEKKFVLSIAVLAAFCCAGCHKTCTCVRYDGTDRNYTAEEVDSYGVKCSTMRDAVNRQLGTLYYSYCEWTE